MEECELREGWKSLYLVLYPGGGVLVWQGIVAVAGDGCRRRGWDGRVCVERVEGLHAADGAGDHCYGVGGHEWHILWGSPQGQRIVRRAPQGLQIAVDAARRERCPVLQLHPLLLHLQRH